jgi:hypothetical protein
MSEKFNFAPIVSELNHELASGGEARKTFDVLLERQHSRQSAFDLMFRAKVFCINETLYGLPDRWPTVILSLRDGRTFDELFPADLYRKQSGQGN